jgi:hypothetical protein
MFTEFVWFTRLFFSALCLGLSWLRVVGWAGLGFKYERQRKVGNSARIFMFTDLFGLRGCCLIFCVFDTRGFVLGLGVLGWAASTGKES